MKDLKKYIIESKRKLSNVSKDIFKYDILGISGDDKELNNDLDSWFNNHKNLNLYLDNEAQIYFKAEKLNYEFIKIDKGEINNILDILKKDSKSYSTNYGNFIISNDIIYSKSPDGIVIIK